MLKAKELASALSKIMANSEVGKNARIQVRTADGVYHDVKSMRLLENRIFGARESHRIVIEVIPERAPMGRVIKDHGGIIL